jgi:hypothetical protein
MDLNSFVGGLALLVAAYTAYLTRQQVQMLKAGTASRNSPNRGGVQQWWRAPSVLAVALLAVITWVPWLYGLSQRPSFGPGRFEYGSLPDGRLFIAQEIQEDRPDRKIIAIAFHYYGNVDINDAPGLQKSKPFDFRKGVQLMIIEPDEAFKDEVKRGMSGTNFMTLDIPAGVTEDQFSTLRQAYKLGARLMVGAAKHP